ncbi:hypothetical protein LU632_05685 [Erwinia tracheiphila]|uniref:hypothetical protein n=1 Tax=Erwinia tracheiphila TaxID=65700 RepID=UPI001F19D727|nr:hypothetical protein [Erwinia tracheiphila]UIA93065.1 hypothetical protein LU632_05685 [Erwinia tracheiphila]
MFRFGRSHLGLFYPPNDWGCRCRVRTLTAAQVKRMGLTVAIRVPGAITTPDGETALSKRTGEVYER